MTSVQRLTNLISSFASAGANLGVSAIHNTNFDFASVDMVAARKRQLKGPKKLPGKSDRRLCGQAKCFKG